MITFNTQLPQIFAEKLDTREKLENLCSKLKTTPKYAHAYVTEDGTRINYTEYVSGYADSVSVFENPLVSLGVWKVWASSDPTNFFFVTNDADTFTPDLIPTDLITSLRLIVKDS